jgi:nitroreductase
MDVYEAIARRRSVRAYQDTPIDVEVLKRVLDAGRLAPSGRNLQNWMFVVVRDPQVREELRAAIDQPWTANVPVFVAVVSTVPERTMFCGVPASPVDCAIAIDHMTLAATAEGLGSCWIGHFEQEPAKAVLHVPEEMTIIEILALGWPAEQAETPGRKQLEEVVRHDRFA